MDRVSVPGPCVRDGISRGWVAVWPLDGFDKGLQGMRARYMSRQD